MEYGNMEYFFFFFFCGNFIYSKISGFIDTIKHFRSFYHITRGQL